MLNDAPITEPIAQKPNTFWLRLWLAGQALLNLFSGAAIIVQINRLARQNAIEVPARLWLFLLIPLLGFVAVVAAVLISRNKRIGLKLCLALVVLNTVMALASILIYQIQLEPRNLAELFLGFWAAYYAYKYLTHEPEKPFFT